jgi:hypothetical protein
MAAMAKVMLACRGGYRAKLWTDAVVNTMGSVPRNARAQLRPRRSAP